MKYLILVGDGMGDLPIGELGCSTLLQAAHTPNMDRIAQTGYFGLTQTIQPDQQPGSDAANMSLMGYDPAKYLTGRSPLEAAAMGLELAPDEISFRCNLVTLDRSGEQTIMTDYAAGHLPTEQADEIMVSLNQALGGDELRFHTGVSFRNLLIWKNGPINGNTVPPHDRTGQAVDDALGLSGEVGRITDLIRKSWDILKDHPTNKRRLEDGQVPANSIWLWGQGTKPTYPGIKERFGVTGVVVSAVDLIRGLGRLAGMEVVEVEGATGYLDTNYQGKVDAVLDGLKRHDLAFLHVEAPDETGHEGNIYKKLQAIEDFDDKVVGPVMKGLAELGPHRVLLATDHFTPIVTKTHGRQPVPFVIWDSEREQQGGPSFTEADAASHGNLVPKAYNLAEMLINGDWDQQ